VRLESRPKARGCRQLDFIIHLDDMTRPQIIHLEDRDRLADVFSFRRMARAAIGSTTKLIRGISVNDNDWRSIADFRPKNFRCSLSTCPTAGFAVAQAVQKGDTAPETPGNLANIGQVDVLMAGLTVT
jgi:hypothetical protein